MNNHELPVDTLVRVDDELPAGKPSPSWEPIRALTFAYVEGELWKFRRRSDRFRGLARRRLLRKVAKINQRSRDDRAKRIAAATAAVGKIGEFTPMEPAHREWRGRQVQGAIDAAQLKTAIAAEKEACKRALDYIVKVVREAHREEGDA